MNGAPERITCPVCGRTGRSVTKDGRIRDHDVPASSRQKTRFCLAGGMNLDAARRAADA